jgi:type IV secretion system protein VirB1
MALSWVAVTALAAACSPSVAPSTLAAIAKVESGFDPWAIGVNGPHPKQLHPASAAAATAAAQRLIAGGANVDLGLAQINVHNLASLGLTIANAFEPCRNLAASARVLAADYRAADPAIGEQAALRTSISLYNTGDPLRGFRNGYVAKVTAAATLAVPALDPSATAMTESAVPPPPAWDVFARSAGTTKTFVIQPQISGDRP